jgi:bacterioferritin
MKGNDDVLALLNDLLTAELTSINQHYVHAKMCANWGIGELAGKHRSASISEMKHADKLIERILLLEGVPNLQRYDPLVVGEDPKEQLSSDLTREQTVVSDYNAGIAACVKATDNGSRELLEDLLIAHEEHLDWIETQMHLIATVGEKNYLAERM